MASMIETELLKATGLEKSPEDHRQDYLASLVREINRLPEKKWDKLSDLAVQWYDKAASALEEKDEIPSFDDEEDDPVEDEDEADDGSDTEDEEPDEEVVETGPVQGPAPKTNKIPKSPTSQVSEGTEDAPEHAAPPKPKSNAKGKKDKPKGYRGNPNIPDHGEVPVTNRWGLTVGTKTAQAVDMYERGTTAHELMQKLGGRHYNILKRLMEAGHRVEKGEHGFWKVVHKDDLAEEQAKPKAKKGKK